MFEPSDCFAFCQFFSRIILLMRLSPRLLFDSQSAPLLLAITVLAPGALREVGGLSSLLRRYKSLVGHATSLRRIEINALNIQKSLCWRNWFGLKNDRRLTLDALFFQYGSLFAAYYTNTIESSIEITNSAKASQFEFHSDGEYLILHLSSSDIDSSWSIFSSRYASKL